MKDSSIRWFTIDPTRARDASCRTRKPSTRRSRSRWRTIRACSCSVRAWTIRLPCSARHAASTPYDAKGLLLSAILDNNPVCVFEHRWLMKKDGVVPQGFYRVPIGKGIYRRRGADVTIVGASHAIELGMQAATALASDGIDAEVIDLRTVKPLDESILLESLRKTGRVVTVDTAWMKGGVCAEIGCLAAEKGYRDLKAP